MLFAAHRGLAALEVEGRPLRTGVMQAHVANIHHAVLSVLPAVRRHLLADHIEVRVLRAGVIQTAPAANIYHAVLRMLFAVRRQLAFDVEGPSPWARVM